MTRQDNVDEPCQSDIPECILGRISDPLEGVRITLSMRAEPFLSGQPESSIPQQDKPLLCDEVQFLETDGHGFDRDAELFREGVELNSIVASRTREQSG